MREILFRGKAKETGEWIEGFYTIHRDSLLEGIVHHYIVAQEKNKNGLLNPLLTWYIVIPETVGQFTGLTANGKKIFEGDVVAGAVYWLGRQKNGLVAFRDGSFGLIWHRGDVEQFNPFTSMCNIEYEVIGNIHDDSELLKGGAEG